MEASYEDSARVHQIDTIWKTAIIETIREHNNNSGSALYMKLGKKQNILSMSLDDRRTLTPELFGRPADLMQFKKTLAILYLEAYGMSVFDLKAPSFVERFSVTKDHATILISHFPSDDFIGYMKLEQNQQSVGEMPTGVVTANIPDDVVENYLKAARERAEGMGAKDNPDLNLSGIVLEGPQ